ncbi:MAG: sodium:calcium antiporter [Nitrososphaerales archaeon]
MGFVILATSTSIPEATVAFTASIDREFEIAIGNVLGSNIANICLIIGVPTIYLCFRRIYCMQYLPKMEKHEVDSLFFGLMIASVVPLYLAYRDYASMPIGIILLVIFLVYNIYLSRTGITIKDLGVKPSHKRKKFGKEVLRLIFGVAIVVLCAYFIVNSASNIAEALGASKTLIGGTIIAVGTSLPELVVSFKAMVKKQPGLAYGNAIGSCFTNITLILGIVFVISEPIINMRLYINMIVMSLIANIFFGTFLR